MADSLHADHLRLHGARYSKWLPRQVRLHYTDFPVPALHKSALQEPAEILHRPIAQFEFALLRQEVLLSLSSTFP